jgi:hypothetical protein
VQREDDRDRAIDRALRQSLRGPMSDPGEHIDGETLAAWAEGQLRPEAAARAEEHASNCGQCQQMLAAFARTAPPPPVTKPIWSRWHLQWLVPIATAATVAAIWVVTPREEHARATSPLVDRVTEAPRTPPAATVAPAEPQNAVGARSPAPPPSAKEFKQSPSLPVGQSAAGAAKREEFERRDAPTAERQADAFAQPQAAPVAPPVGPQAGTQEKDSGKPRQLQETVAVAPASPAAAAAPPASTADASAGNRGLRDRAADTRELAARAFAAPPEIRSPNSTNRWRIVNGGRQLERSTSGGSQWETASLSSPGVMTAGMSPASSVCWIVGRAGAVYVTTDGLRFVRVMFPESIDLVSVTATDDRHATVMSADGRSFRTDDHGATWTRVAP